MEITLICYVYLPYIKSTYWFPFVARDSGSSRSIAVNSTGPLPGKRFNCLITMQSLPFCVRAL